MELSKIIGLIAATLSTVTFVPQVWKTWKSRSSRDLSMGTVLIVMISTSLWLTYGLMIDDTPVIMANSLTLILSFVLLYSKIKYR